MGKPCPLSSAGLAAVRAGHDRHRRRPAAGAGQRLRGEGGWPRRYRLSCGAATLFWLFVAPAWLAARWRVESGAAARGHRLAGAHRRVGGPGADPGPLARTAARAHGRGVDRRHRRLLCRPRLRPTSARAGISPGKTWEGVYGALAATALYALAWSVSSPRRARCGPLRSSASVSGWRCCSRFAAVSIVGDLFESLLKRQRGIKDSGRILPGHGGLLDRIDALLAAMPAAALIVQYVLR